LQAAIENSSTKQKRKKGIPSIDIDGNAESSRAHCDRLLLHRRRSFRHVREQEVDPRACRLGGQRVHGQKRHVALPKEVLQELRLLYSRGFHGFVSRSDELAPNRAALAGTAHERIRRKKE